MQEQDIAIVKDLSYCLNVLAEVIAEQELTKEQERRVKYVQKMVVETTDKFRNPPPRPSYFIFKDDGLIGKLDLQEMVLTITGNLNGRYSITPLTDKGVVTTLLLEEKQP